MKVLFYIHSEKYHPHKYIHENIIFDKIQSYKKELEKNPFLGKFAIHEEVVSYAYNKTPTKKLILKEINLYELYFSFALCFLESLDKREPFRYDLSNSRYIVLQSRDDIFLITEQGKRRYYNDMNQVIYESQNYMYQEIYVNKIDFIALLINSIERFINYMMLVFHDSREKMEDLLQNILERVFNVKKRFLEQSLF